MHIFRRRVFKRMFHVISPLRLRCLSAFHTSPGELPDFNIELMTASAALFPDMRAFPTFWVISNSTVAIISGPPWAVWVTLKIVYGTQSVLKRCCLRQRHGGHEVFRMQDKFGIFSCGKLGY